MHLLKNFQNPVETFAQTYALTVPKALKSYPSPTETLGQTLALSLAWTLPKLHA